MHLSGASLSEESHSVIDAFLQGTTTTTTEQQRRLFVWLPVRTNLSSLAAAAATMSISPAVAVAGWTLPKTAVASALVFCRTDTATTANQVDAPSPQLACMTLPAPPPVSSTQSDNAADSSSSASASSTNVLQALTVYTQQCFLPTIQSILDEDTASTVVEKIRALEVALQQSSRSARLPVVQLAIHPVVQTALDQHPAAAKNDWEALALADKLSDDDDFLNELQASVSAWIGQIRTLTVLPQSTPLVVQESPDQPPNADAVAHELAFWTQLSAELTHVQEQLSSPAVETVCSLLREAKRFVATLALENNTGLEQAVTYTTDMLHFLKGYPITDLQAATDWEQVAAAVQAIFDHLPKIRSSRYYSLPRSVALVEGTTVVLRNVILQLLQADRHKNLLFMEYSEYQQKIRYPVLDVLVQFQDRWEEWKDFVLEQGRRRKVTGLSKVLEKMTLHHAVLRERLDQLDEFRQAQETLRKVVHTVLRQEEPAALQQVEQAPRQIFGGVQVLDLSPSGKQALDAALEEYDLQMDAMEERLARLLRDKLQACQVCGVLPSSCPESVNFFMVLNQHLFLSFAGCGGYVWCFCSLQPAADEDTSAYRGQRVSNAAHYHSLGGSPEASVQVHAQV